MDESENVKTDFSAEAESIRKDALEAEITLDDMRRDLQAADRELETIADKQPQFDVLKRVCNSLVELEDADASHLFWDSRAGVESQAERLRYAQQQLDAYDDERVRVENHKASILAKVDEQNITLDELHYDLRDLIDREERRNAEWLVERDENELPSRVQVMPWARGEQEDQRFHRSLGSSMAASIALALLFSMIAIPLVDRTEENKLPERVAKLVREERALPPPPPVEQPVIPDEEIPEPEPELVEEIPPEQLPKSAEEPVLAEEVDTKEQVKTKGILAFRDSFADRADLRPNVELGSEARINTAGEDAVGRPERLMVATSAPGSSGGINLSNISRDVGGGGGAMEGVQLTRVASSIGAGDGPNRPLAGGAIGGRTDEEIQIVFDRYKAALYRLYNRELRKDPTLRGQLVLQLTIEPDGSVSLCQLYASDMDAPALANQVVQRVGNFDFGSKEDISAITIIYPIDFLPAA